MWFLLFFVVAIFTNETIELIDASCRVYVVKTINNKHKPMHFLLGIDLRHAESVWSFDDAVRCTSTCVSPTCKYTHTQKETFLNERRRKKNTSPIVSFRKELMIHFPSYSTHLLHISPLSACRLTIKVQCILIHFVRNSAINAEGKWIIWLCRSFSAMEN